MEEGIAVHQAWGWTAGEEVDESAFFLTIVNRSAEEEFLFGIETDACAEARVLEIVEDSHGRLGTAPIEGNELEIPAGSTVRLRRGGRHISCLGVQRELLAGEMVALRLLFSDSGAVDVEAEIRPRPDSTPGTDGVNE